MMFGVSLLSTVGSQKQRAYILGEKKKGIQPPPAALIFLSRPSLPMLRLQETEKSPCNRYCSFQVWFLLILNSPH